VTIQHTIIRSQRAVDAALEKQAKLLRESLRITRKEKEASGIEVTLTSDAVISVDTDADDQSKFQGLFIAAQAGLIEGSINFKGKGRFFTISPFDVGTIAAAMHVHVQRCYDAENVTLSKVNSGEIRTADAAEIDFNAAFDAL
jgi:hypothetical protein